MNTALLLNGLDPIESDFQQIKAYDSIYCTDGAFHLLEKRKINSHAVIGDFDSIQTIDLKSDIFVHRPDQNFTDFEKSLAYLDDLETKSIDVFGASGGEQDHFLGNLYVARKWKKRFTIRFFDQFQIYYIAGQNEILHNVLGKKISLMPFYYSHKVYTSGLMYSLNQEDLSFDGRIGIRNKAISSQVKINHMSGDLIIFIER